MIFQIFCDTQVPSKHSLKLCNVFTLLQRRYSVNYLFSSYINILVFPKSFGLFALEDLYIYIYIYIISTNSAIGINYLIIDKYIFFIDPVLSRSGGEESFLVINVLAWLGRTFHEQLLSGAVCARKQNYLSGFQGAEWLESQSQIAAFRIHLILTWIRIRFQSGSGTGTE